VESLFGLAKLPNFRLCGQLQIFKLSHLWSRLTSC
jgi:hypothetical protein